jgi:hypothetical protein
MAGGLGWAGGAAVGAKLAAPGRVVVALVGDGSFLFGIPSSAQWVARRYGAPALTILYDNRGWAAPKFSALRLHPDGAAAANDDFPVSLEPEVDMPAVARASAATELDASSSGLMQADDDIPGHVGCVGSRGSELAPGRHAALQVARVHRICRMMRPTQLRSFRPGCCRYAADHESAGREPPHRPRP